MVKISFLGGCREVGRSAVLIESKNGEKCLLDYGVRFNDEERLPYETNFSDLRAIALTHCHIDHSGALPFIYKGASPPLFTNPLTLRIIETLIEDMIKVSNYPYPFGLRDLGMLVQHAYFLKNSIRHRISDNFFITFFNAGHVPGSVSILIEVDNKKILYTGDLNTQITNLVNPAEPSSIPGIDVCIIESTYALKEHPLRESLEKSFADNVINITENGGKVLVPAFGVARSQEALMILNKFNYTGNLFLDGMTKLICNIYLDFPESLKSNKAYRTALKRAKFVSKKKIRDKIENSYGVIIAPSGMLNGGAALFYIGSILKDSLSAIYLVGYQVEGTPGRGLLDNGIFKFKERNKYRRGNDDINLKAQCDYKYFDFSSHGDALDIYRYVEHLKFRNSSKDLFCIHGDNKSTTALASDLAKKSYNSVAPEIGEVYKI